TRPAQTQCGRLGNAPAASAASAEDESLDCQTGPQAPLPNAMMRATPAPPAEGGQARPAPLLFRARDSYRMAETRRFGVRGAAAPITQSGLPDAPAYSDFRGISDPMTAHSPSPFSSTSAFDRQSWRSIPVPIVCGGKHGMALMTGASSTRRKR